MRKSNGLCVAALAACVLSRVAFAARRSQALGAAAGVDAEGPGSNAIERTAAQRSASAGGSGTSAIEGIAQRSASAGESGSRAIEGVAQRTASAGGRGSAAQGRWLWRQLHENVGLPSGLRDLVMKFMPIRYHWIALGRRSDGVTYVGIWEVAVWLPGGCSDHIHFWGEFAPCKAAESHKLQSLVGHLPDLSFAAFLPRGQELLIACDDSHSEVFLEAWHIPSRHLAHRLEHKFYHHYNYYPFRPLTLEHLFSHNSPPRQWFVGETKDGVGIWNTSSWRRTWYRRHRVPYTTAFSPNGAMLAMLEESVEGWGVAEKVSIFDIASGRELCGASLAGSQLAMRGSDHRVGFTGKWLTVCDPRGGSSVTFRVYPTKEGCRLADTGKREPCCDATGSGLVLYGSGNRVFVSTMGGDARRPLYHTSFGTDFTWRRQDCVCAKFSLDGRRALFRHRSQWFLWSFAEGRPPWATPVGGMVFSDDGDLLVGLGEAGLRLMEAGSGVERDVAVDPSASTLAPHDYEETLAVGGAHRRRPALQH